MTDGIIQKVFDRKTKCLADYWTAFAIEELKHELIIELSITNRRRTTRETNHEANTTTLLVVFHLGVFKKSCSIGVGFHNENSVNS